MTKEKGNTLIVKNNKVYTIEGNTTGDMCKQNQYDVGSSVILGYGTPAYQ